MQVTYQFELTNSLTDSLAAVVAESPNRLLNLDVSEYESVEPCAALLALGIASGRHSRFNEDHNISRAMFERMYHTWTRNSTNHTARGHGSLSHIAINMMSPCRF